MTVNLHHYVEPTDVTFQWIVEQLDGKDRRWDACRKGKRRITKLTYEIISGGYLSNVAKVDIHFGSHHQFSFFLKAPCMNKFKVLGENKSLYGFIDQMAVGLIHYHNHELLFYELVAPHYGGLHFARIFGQEPSDAATGRHGRLLLESLADRAVMADVVQGLSITQCCAVMQQLARFHAFGRCAPRSADWRRRLAGNHRLQLHDAELQIWRRCTQLDADYFVRHERAYRNLLESAFAQPSDAHHSFGVQPTICHGDLWANNILFEKDEHGHASDKVYAIIDWQAVHVGTGVDDIARFILLSTSDTVQKMCTDRFLRVYYETLHREMNNHGQTPDFSFDKLKDMYMFHYPHECIFAANFLSMCALKQADPVRRFKLVQRLVANFEPIRARLESMVCLERAV